MFFRLLIVCIHTIKVQHRMSKNNDENKLMLQVVKAHTKRETPGKGERGGFTSVTDMQVTMDPIFEFVFEFVFFP